MARRRRGLQKGQRTVTGKKAKEGPRLVRARFYRDSEEYEELDEEAINRIYQHLRKPSLVKIRMGENIIGKI